MNKNYIRNSKKIKFTKNRGICKMIKVRELKVQPSQILKMCQISFWKKLIQINTQKY